MGSLQCESITKIMDTWVCAVIANDMEELDLLAKLLPHGSFYMPNKADYLIKSVLTLGSK